MDDRELIRRIMEEVKDEKLREELLRRVVKGEGGSVEKILKRIEHRLKAQDSLAKQEIMHGRTEKIAKIEWWVSLAYPLYLVIFFGLAFILVYYGFEGLEKIPTWVFVVIAVVSLAAAFVIRTYYLLEGKKEYERRKKEEEEFEK
jgi:type VI protein secretion system component VasF